MLTRLFLIILVLLQCSASQVFAVTATAKPSSTEGKNVERRTALVIGNATYSKAPLENPVHDAEDMANMLKQAGFTVDLRLNINQRQMERAIQNLGNNLIQGGVGLFYYAGHGIQVRGVNYLIPIGADIATEEDVRFEAVDANRALAQMQLAGNRLNMVFLDACRNNPYQRTFRSVGTGLAAMNAPRGSLVSFATAPGKVAAEGTGRNGIYTKHLLKQMAKKNLELGRMMKQVRRGVQRDTGNNQIPFELSSLIGDFYFHGTVVAAEPQVVTSENKAKILPVRTGADLMWEMVQNTTDPVELRLFITEYPGSRYQGMAKLLISRLEQK